MLLLSYLYEYKDPNKDYVIETLSKIEYFHLGLSKASLHDLIYRFDPCFYEAGESILRVDDTCTAMYLVVRGVVEVYIEIEGHEFVLENLYPGSSFNTR
mmetsp:Transcript_18764/g.28848  ORF Transcript_18764/g.28848 Transcript_18764/m.28848 type:complete len:99 (-) Transcript_18764:1737-2033(-)